MLTVCGLTACGADFESSSQISKLRLLALRADAPFAEPEQTVELEPLLADPEPRSISCFVRALRHAWPLLGLVTGPIVASPSVGAKTAQSAVTSAHQQEQQPASDRFFAISLVPTTNELPKLPDPDQLLTSQPQ